MDARRLRVVERVDHVSAHEAAPVPDAANVVAGDDLGKATCLDVADLDEATVEQKDIWWMPRDMLRRALPLDSAD